MGTKHSVLVAVIKDLCSRLRGSFCNSKPHYLQYKMSVRRVIWLFYHSHHNIAPMILVAGSYGSVKNYTNNHNQTNHNTFVYGTLARYAKLRVAHAPGMPGTFSPPPRVSDPDVHHDTCVTHVPWCMPGSLTSGFLWSRWRGKRSRHYLRMRNAQFRVSGKRSIHFIGQTIYIVKSLV